ncbi:MAG TPA: tetratricopeptide repeat protein, partial [Burkholderiales bacterium]|nr:tetratricopeptide repeat protein [Burkholderiales bacterium]
MTDWISASAMLLAGLVVGAIFLYGMRRRQQSGDVERADLEARRDALLAQLRSVDNSAEERARLEAEAAAVLRKLDRRGTPRPSAARAAEGGGAPRSNHAALKGFIWGAASVAVLAGMGWFVMESAKPKESARQDATAPAQTPAADPMIAELERRVQQDPENLALRDDLARAYLDKDNINGVAEQTQYVLKRSPDDARALTYQALVHIAARQPEAAAAMLTRATKSDPKLLDAWIGLAWLHAQTGDLKKAEAALQEAKKQHPEESARLDELMAHLRNPQQTPGSAASAPAAAPSSEPPAASAAPAAPGEAVHITLNAGPGPYPPAAVIFIIAREAGTNGGPPSAVKRVPLAAFPIKVDLTSADSMMGQPLPPKLRIEAR